MKGLQLKLGHSIENALVYVLKGQNMNNRG